MHKLCSLSFIDPNLRSVSSWYLHNPGCVKQSKISEYCRPTTPNLLLCNTDHHTGNDSESECKINHPFKTWPLQPITEHDFMLGESDDWLMRKLADSTTMDERIKTCFWWWSLIIMVALCPQSGLSSRTLQKHESLMCDKQYPTVTVKTVYSFVHDKDLYSAFSVELLRTTANQTF